MMSVITGILTSLTATLLCGWQINQWQWWVFISFSNAYILSYSFLKEKIG